VKLCRNKPERINSVLPVGGPGLVTSSMRTIYYICDVWIVLRGEQPLRRRDDLRASCCSIWYWHLDIAIVLRALQPPHNISNCIQWLASYPETHGRNRYSHTGVAATTRQQLHAVAYSYTQKPYWPSEIKPGILSWRYCMLQFLTKQILL
jgi:hypothetical protein